MDDEGKLFNNVMEPYLQHRFVDYKLYFTATLGLSKLSKDSHLLMLKYSFKHGETTNQVTCVTLEVYRKTVHALGHTHGDIRIENMVLILMEILIKVT